MSLPILGLGTALPQHTMTQEEALDMSTNIICQDERQRRLMRVLFRRAAVQNRHTAVPHPIAYEWAQAEADARHAASGNGHSEVSWGPTTRERMQLYADNAAPLAKTAAGAGQRSTAVSP